MDNLPLDQNQNISDENTSGEVFSNQQESAYSQAVSTPPEFDTAQKVYQEPQESTSGQEDSQAPQADDTPEAENPPPSSPPPYKESNFKKFLVLGIILCFFLLVLFVVFKIISSRSKKQPKNGGTKPQVTLTYWGLWDSKEVMSPLIEEYQKSHESVKINYIQNDPKQYRERLQSAIDRGEGPDIYRFHNTWVPMMLNYLSPIPESIVGGLNFENTFYPVATYDLKVGTKYYGIPLMIDGLMLYYNEDIIKSANVTIPTTWMDLQNIVPKITVQQEGRIVTSAISLGTANNVEHFSDILALMMLQNGTKLTQSLSTCNNPSSTTCAVEALSFYHKFVETESNVYTWDERLENSIVSFASGKTAMILAPSWQFFTIKGLNPTLNFKTALVPQLPCQTDSCQSVNFASYWVEGVSNKSQNTQQAWEFLNYLVQAENLQKLYEQQAKTRQFFGSPYSRVDLGDKLLDDPYLAPLIKSAPTMKSFYLASSTYDGETGINTSLIKYLKDAISSLSQGTSPESALQTADNGFKQVFSRFGIKTASAQ